jgi:hypothetical protein
MIQNIRKFENRIESHATKSEWNIYHLLNSSELLQVSLCCSCLRRSSWLLFFAVTFEPIFVGHWFMCTTLVLARVQAQGKNILPFPWACTRATLDLLQVSLSLSYRSTIVYITWRSTEGRSEKERLVNFGKLGSKLNRKCKTCLNYFPSISFCIIYYNGTHVIYMC